MSLSADCGRSLCPCMWCAGLDSRRHLAVNNGVRRSTSDSDAVRSVRVPNLKQSARGRHIMAQRAVSDQREPDRLRAAPFALRRGSRQPITVASTAPPDFVIAPLAVDETARERQLIRSAVILAKHFHQLFGRRFAAAIELRHPLFARCHLIVSPPQCAETKEFREPKSLNPSPRNKPQAQRRNAVSVWSLRRCSRAMSTLL